MGPTSRLLRADTRVGPYGVKGYFQPPASYVLLHCGIMSDA